MFNETLKYVNNNTENVDSPSVFGAGVQVMAVGAADVASARRSQSLPMPVPHNQFQLASMDPLEGRAEPLSREWSTSGKACARKGKKILSSRYEKEE